MSVSVSTAARYFATTDPKYLALALAFFNVAVVYGGRTMAHLQLNKKERAVAEAKKNAAKPDIGDR